MIFHFVPFPAFAVSVALVGFVSLAQPFANGLATILGGFKGCPVKPGGVLYSVFLI